MTDLWRKCLRRPVVVEEQGILWNRDIDRIPPGRRSGGQVELLSAFRGGTIDLRTLRRAAVYSWSHGYNIGEVYAHSRSTEATSRRIAVGMIDAILKDLRRGKSLDQRGRELTGWEDVYVAYLEGQILGLASTGLTLADSLTFGQIDGINRLNNRLWEDAGLAGSGWQVGSQIASRIGVEVGLTALTLGTGAALRGARAAAQAGGAAEKGSRIVRGAKAFFNTANSPLAAQARKLAGGSQLGTGILKGANWGLRGWEAVNTGRAMSRGVNSVARGDYTGFFDIALGGLSAFGAVRGGYGATRRAAVNAVESAPGQRFLARHGVGNSSAARTAANAARERATKSVRASFLSKHPNLNRLAENPGLSSRTSFIEVTHSLIPARARYVPNIIKHSRFQLYPRPAVVHARLDPARWRFVKSSYKKEPEFAPYGLWDQFWIGLPPQLQAAYALTLPGSLGAGYLLGEAMIDDE